MTVLPTPAPPKSPILPPFTNGATRSTTLMPVSKTSVFGSRLTKSGRLRWIGQRSASAGIGAPLSTGSPSTFRMRPSAGAPTGTEIAAPVSTTSMPRVTPSVLDMATARTWLRPMCCCTSTTTRMVWPLGRDRVDAQRVVELGQVIGLELDVEHRADDLDDLADRSRGGSCCHGTNALGIWSDAVARLPYSAAAPPTISAISCVICAWRAVLYVRL